MGPSGSTQIIDEPMAVLQEVQNHFQRWTAKRQVQPLSGRWVEVYSPVQSIEPSWYSGLMTCPTLREVQQAISKGPVGRAGGPTQYNK